MGELRKIADLAKPQDGSRDALLDEILADLPLREELKKLGVKDEEIPHYVTLLSSYREGRDCCSRCRDASHCLSPFSHNKKELMIGSAGNLETYLAPCPKEEKKLFLASRFLYRDFPDELLASTFSRSESDLAVRNYLKGCLDESSRQRWAYIYGPSGSGKSRVLMAFLRFYAEKKGLVAYFTASKLVEMARNYSINDKERFASFSEELSRVPLLAIDDLGDEYSTPFVRQQFMLPLLKERARKRYPTLFTSSYSLDELRQIYGGSRANYTDPIAKNLVELIQSNIVGGEPFSLSRNFESYLAPKEGC